MATLTKWLALVLLVLASLFGTVGCGGGGCGSDWGCCDGG